MKWYWKIFPWLMFDYYKAKGEDIIREQKAIAQEIVNKAEQKLKEIKQGNVLVRDGHETQYCFESGGEDYFSFINDFNIPVERAFAAMDIYAEYDQRTELPYHQTAYKAILECVKKAEVGKIFVICDNALERMQHITNIDLIYKLASVLYIDKYENPYQYDVAYNRQKIAKWKKDADIESFFLKLPINSLIPSFTGLEVNINSYTQFQRKDTLKKLQFQLAQFSKEEKGTGIYLQAKLLEGTLLELVKSGE
jgi:hypothetical protein